MSILREILESKDMSVAQIQKKIAGGNWYIKGKSGEDTKEYYVRSIDDLKDLLDNPDIANVEKVMIRRNLKILGEASGDVSIISVSPRDTETIIKVLVANKKYEYSTSQYFVDKFTFMLKKGAGYRALNFLKKNADLISKPDSNNRQLL